VIVVSDTTPLSELSKVGQLILLREVFGQVIVPQEVYDEVTSGTHPAVAAVRSATWIEVRSVQDASQVVALRESTKIHVGEAAAIILAEELGAQQVLIDDLRARRVAKARLLPVTGTIGTLLLAKEQGMIAQVKPILDDLIALGKRISPQLYQDVLAIAQES
jgi:predicted nucleic acid-binding protein